MHVPVTVNGKNPYRGNLYVGDGDVEQIVHVGKPDHAHVRDDHGAQVALVTEQVERIVKTWNMQKGQCTEISDRFYKKKL